MQINPGLQAGQARTYGGMSLAARQLMKGFCEQWGMPCCPTQASPFDFEDWQAQTELSGQ